MAPNFSTPACTRTRGLSLAKAGNWDHSKLLDPRLHWTQMRITPPED